MDKGGGNFYRSDAPPSLLSPDKLRKILRLCTQYLACCARVNGCNATCSSKPQNLLSAKFCRMFSLGKQKGLPNCF